MSINQDQLSSATLSGNTKVDYTANVIEYSLGAESNDFRFGQSVNAA